MKKNLKSFIILVVIFLGAFSVYKFSNKYDLNILKNNIDCTIIAKGCENAKAIAVDEEGNTYIAFSDYIKSINREGKEKSVYKNKEINIEDMVYYNNKLIYISEDKICEFSLSDESTVALCSKVPLAGNNIKRRLFLSKDLLYISVGAKTNAGISDGEYADISPVSVTLLGNNYGEKLTGAFKKYGMRSENGEKVNPETIGNAAIYSLNLKNKELSLFSTGVRGIKGIADNSKGEITAILSGMENKGLRPVNRDKDYIYKIEKGIFYGWPDFSGGDPISSPRFKGDELVKPLIKSFKDKKVPAPIYQSEDINTLQGLAVDKNGDVLEKDTILFWDSKSEKICTLSNQNVYKEILKLKDSSNVENIIYTEKAFLLLDNKAGCVYSLHRKGNVLGFRIPVVIIFFLFILVVSLAVIILYKFTRKNEK